MFEYAINATNKISEYRYCVLFRGHFPTIVRRLLNDIFLFIGYTIE